MPPTRRSTRATKGKTGETVATEAAPSKPAREDVSNNAKKRDSAKSKTVSSTISASNDATSATTTSSLRPKDTPFTIPASGKGMKPIPCLRSHERSPSSPPLSLIFTHGAGGDLSAPAMTNFSRGFASPDAAMVSFQGNMNLKARTAMFAAVKEYEAQHNGPQSEVEAPAFGGRSMGARAAVIASHTDQSVKALVLASYPLVGPGGDIRDQILLQVRPEVDVLFISGDGDHMCPLPRLQSVRDKMKARTWLCVVHGADHGMNVKGGKNLKLGTERVGMQAGRVARLWVQAKESGRREGDASTTRDMVLTWDGVGQKVLGVWGDEEAVALGPGEGDANEDKGGIKRYFTKTADDDDEKEDAVVAKRKKTKR